ncbi:hypothetical protein ACSVDA_11920 [Cytobacillus sp. Hm23]
MDAVVYGKVVSLEKKIGRIVTIRHDEELVSIESPLTVSLPIEPKTDKLLLKTVFVEGPEGSAVEIEIVSCINREDQFLFYRNSISANTLYDLIDIPYVDEDGTGNLHLNLNNVGSTSGPYKIRISALFAQ